MNARTLVKGLRLVPAALLLGILAVNAPATSATDDLTVVDGGYVSNDTDLDASTDGGGAYADAGGGNYNAAAAGWFGDAEAGTGGYADADAAGGTIEVGNVNSGQNQGNDIFVDD